MEQYSRQSTFVLRNVFTDWTNWIINDHYINISMNAKQPWKAIPKKHPFKFYSRPFIHKQFPTSLEREKRHRFHKLIRYNSWGNIDWSRLCVQSGPAAVEKRQCTLTRSHRFAPRVSPVPTSSSADDELTSVNTRPSRYLSTLPRYVLGH